MCARPLLICPSLFVFVNINGPYADETDEKWRQKESDVKFGDQNANPKIICGCVIDLIYPRKYFLPKTRIRERKAFNTQRFITKLKDRLIFVLVSANGLENA